MFVFLTGIVFFVMGFVVGGEVEEVASRVIIGLLLLVPSGKTLISAVSMLKKSNLVLTEKQIYGFVMYTTSIFQFKRAGVIDLPIEKIELIEIISSGRVLKVHCGNIVYRIFWMTDLEQLVLQTKQLKY